MKEYEMMKKIPGQLIRGKMLFDPKVVVKGAANAGKAAIKAGKAMGESVKQSQQ